MITIFGIKNCSTMKKACTWLDEHNIKYQFHNYKTEALSPDLLQKFIDLLGYENILNKRGTTWRNLSPEMQASIQDEASAKALMLSNLSIIKRPILLDNKKAMVGFKAEQYQQFFEQSRD